MGRIHWAALAHSPWDHAGEAGFWDRLQANAIALRAASDRAIVLSAGCNLFEWGTFLRRIDQFIMDLVRANIEILSPGGGFVFNTIHNILPDVPPQNIVAMFEAVDEYR